MFSSVHRHDSQRLLSIRAICLSSVAMLRRPAFAVALPERYEGCAQPERRQMRFQGTKDYVATDDLTMAVNAAVILERPLLVKGEPGTGKTVLAREIAAALAKPLLAWNVKSTSKAKEGLYEYDVVQRLNDSRFGDKDISDIRRYIKYGPLGESFRAETQHVLLIDEIDKADIEFPNDLLQELDVMEFVVMETA